ncbi:GDP-mannose 6-dehydrogenase [Litorivivens lipolytica]|uniref:UDP-glucose 6-dehydrogenase n=1 Tax=Litorivivens lipolytica TaxID=1524264 RepID=A0A7W4W5Q7_9GAMM|nr:nucleotide sugar dehydrogenase [Litorivivens lipolytica]MBB3047835.1 GDP-mannose 6-dehydrogenase [Litorivivens lipolytica]
MKHSISVFGLGYVGCVSAACFARAGHSVIGVDINDEKVRLINEEHTSPIVEPGLADLIGAMTEAGRLKATTSCTEAISQSSIAFICVGTPGDRHGKLDLNGLSNVCREIGEALQGLEREFTVVVRSTVLPGTVENTAKRALFAGAGQAARRWLRVAVNPEFIREGTALSDFFKPPFTLVGCDEEPTANLLEDIYSMVPAPIIRTQIPTAETVKYVSNVFHALKICFANEIGDVCAGLGVDAQEVMRIFRLDTKLNISEAYLRPGFAFGGSCLPKDIKALLYAAHHADVALPMLDAILPSNNAQISRAVETVMATGKKQIGVFGLAFKPDTDDLRESPMVTLVETLLGKGCDIRILDRNVAIAKLTGANRRYIVEEIPHISTLMCDSVNALLDHADVVVVSDASESLDLIRSDQIVIDLTRGAVEIRPAVKKAS